MRDNLILQNGWCDEERFELRARLGKLNDNQFVTAWSELLAKVNAVRVYNEYKTDEERLLFCHHIGMNFAMARTMIVS